jgi:ankyrin repeat protein
VTLYEAVEAGDLKAAKKALADGEYVNQVGALDKTPLIEAARMGNLALVKLLLEAGAEPMLKDAEQETAVLKAAANGHRAVCDLLLPHASEDERGMAQAFLGAVGRTDGPNELPAPEPDFLGLKAKAEDLTRKAAVYGARAAKFVGYDKPAERIERIERAEERTGTVTERPKLEPEPKPAKKK